MRISLSYRGTNPFQLQYVHTVKPNLKTTSLTGPSISQPIYDNDNFIVVY